MSPIIPIYCLQVVFTLQGSGTQTKPRSLTELRKLRLEFRKAKMAKIHWTDYQKECCTEGKFWRLVDGSPLIFG